MQQKIIASLACWLLLCLWQPLAAQETFPQNGIWDHREGLYAFTNATIYKSWNERLDNATLLIRRGKVEAIGTQIKVPKEAVVIDATGRTIYPSFIDLYSNYGMPEAKPAPPGGRAAQQQMLSKKEGAYAWNESLMPEFRAHEVFEPDAKTAKVLLGLGFGTVLSHRMDGISRGTSTLVGLGEARAHEMILREQAAHHLSFNKGTSRQAYPSSLMGSIALLRQTYLDGNWYAKQQEEVNLSLAAWNEVQGLPQVFHTGDRLDILRAAKIGKEFGKPYIMRGNGDEYQRLDAIKATGSPIILPLNFPLAYDVEDPFDAQQVTLTQLKHWEMAPANPAKLTAAGISIAFTTDGLEKKTEFLPMLRKAIAAGLSEAEALRALTDTPARLIGASAQVGSLDPGKVASFIITNGNVFAEGAKIYHNWVKGRPHVLADLSAPDLTGAYDLRVGQQLYRLEVKGSAEKPEMNIRLNDTATVKVAHSYEGGLVTLSFALSEKAGKIRLSGSMGSEGGAGQGSDADGQWQHWTATRTGALAAEPKKDERKKEADSTSTGTITYPFTAFGWTEKPQQGTWLIRNATVWTSEDAGILPNTDVLIRAGKIAAVGQNLSDRSATVIDGTNMHLTAGIIDEHSHIAGSRGINEGSQESSAEVRIGDIVNSEDINIYRQLSGGVTAAQILHGSANPIGGQSALIKLRWGYEPEQLKIAGADGFIKFALGENVKQSNWGDNSTTRYPQTRMGVEQVYEDYFTRAREYGVAMRSGKLYRPDLDLETVLEILENKRFISCHSYVQSEINMLMKVAERHGFRVNTFTHILEGYKVADIMAKHGAGGSSFSDWWAYKYEVYGAIPHNGALMHEQGVLVAFNSDDAEMARRLNQEAAKAVLFGNVPEAEAWKFVTINPAKLLHLDQNMGSIKVGKDADVVLWSEHPMSIYARAEKTFVDGIKFFDREEDAKLRQAVASERHRLILKMLEDKKKGGKTQPASSTIEYRHYHCDDEEDEGGGHRHHHDHGHGHGH